MVLSCVMCTWLARIHHLARAPASLLAPRHLESGATLRPAAQSYTYTSLSITNRPWNASQWTVPAAVNYPSTGRNAWLWFAKVTFTVPAGNPALFVAVDRGYPGDMINIFDSTGANVRHQPLQLCICPCCTKQQGSADEAHWLLKCRALLHVRKKHVTVMTSYGAVAKYNECHV